ncbi:MAG TPA: sulfotransferase [Rugosimonospora sp.]|nr:sulfotransferase [Rugosimonospora sp.]
MRVIGVGFGRTGTSSLKSALDMLGFGPCYHMSEVITDRRRVRQWLALANGAPPDWDGLFAGYQSTVDWPAAAYWRALVAAYPKARVVLTVRDPARWYDSVRNTIFRQAVDPPRGAGAAALRLAAVLSPDLRAFQQMEHRTMLRGVFDGRIAEREHAIAVYTRHIDEVQATVPADRLLTYRVADGWPALCDFLEVPVPAYAFPHDNTTESFNQRHSRRLARLALGRLARRHRVPPRA